MQFITPEEMIIKRKRNKTLLYVGIISGMTALSVVLTVLTSQV